MDHEHQSITTKLRDIEVSREALKEANERMQEVVDRREVAINAMIDYALAAYVAGESMESIMEAVDFALPEPGQQMPPAMAQLFGQPAEGPTRIQAFASWLGNVLAQRVMERHAEENPE
jgi:hypothetical protein